MAALAAPQKLHGAVESAFAGERRRRLWRLDRLGERLYLLLLSEDAPELSGVVEQFGTGAAAETRSYDRFAAGGAGQLLAVPADCKPHQKLQRHPKPRSAGNRGRTLHNTVPEAVAVGARRKARLCLREEGFTVTRVQWQHFAKHGTRPVTLLAVTYEGVLQVTDAEQFRALLCQGMGRGKAYGLGLMTVMRAGN